MITGKEFKSKYPTTIFYKLTTETENHNGYQFQDGLNIDTNPINTIKCSKGGLYFTDEKYIYKWHLYNDKKMKYIRKVEILDDSTVFIEDDKYKTDKFVLETREELYENYIFCKLAVQKDGMALQYVKNQTVELYKLAIQQNKLASQYFNIMITGKEFKSLHSDMKFYKLTTFTENYNGFQFKDGLNIYKRLTDDEIYFTEIYEQESLSSQSDINIYTGEVYHDEMMEYIREVEILDDSIIYINDNTYKTDKFILGQRKKLFEHELFCKSAVQRDGHVLRYVKEQTEEICKLAVQQHGMALKYVKNQTDEICKLAVQQQGCALKHVKEQTDEICKLAMKQNRLATKYIKKTIILELKYITNQTEEMCKLFVQKNGCALQSVKNQTDEICKIAVKQNGCALRYVEIQTDEICKIAVKQNGMALQYVKNQTEEICIKAIEQNVLALRYKLFSK